LNFSGQSFEKYTSTKFQENPSCGSRVVICGRTDGRTDMAKLIVAFRNFQNAPNKMGILICLCVWNTDNLKLIICDFAYLIGCVVSCHG